MGQGREARALRKQPHRLGVPRCVGACVQGAQGTAALAPARIRTGSARTRRCPTSSPRPPCSLPFHRPLLSPRFIPQNLPIAEEAYAALEMVDKVTHLQMIRALQSEDERSAEIWLLRRRPKDAEDILLRAQLYRRAVLMNISIYRWENALAIAQKFAKDDVDIVLYLRQRYLEERGQSETLSAFVDLVDVSVDEARVLQKARAPWGPPRWGMCRY